MALQQMVLHLEYFILFKGSLWDIKIAKQLIHNIINQVISNKLIIIRAYENFQTNLLKNRILQERNMKNVSH